MRILLLFGTLVFFTSTPAQAIPPPDLLVTLTQSLLSTLGVLAAFLVAIAYIFKDFIVLLYKNHKRIILYTLGFFFLCLSVGIWYIVSASTY